MIANEARGRPLPTAALWMVPACMLLLALGAMPYGYYVLLRLCVCAACVAVAAAEWRRRGEASGWTVVLGTLAGLFNPLIPVEMPREQWAFIDIGAAAVLLFHYAACRRLAEATERTPAGTWTPQPARAKPAAPRRRTSRAPAKPAAPSRQRASRAPAKPASAPFEPQADSQTLPPDALLEGYQIVRTLGAGGFGITYLAFDLDLNGPVAIKEYFYAGLAVRRPDGAVEPPRSTQRRGDYEWGRARFLQEAQTLSTFSHPNIVRVRRFFEKHNTAYIVMDHVEGESLAAFLERHGTLTPAQWRPWLGALLGGLEHVHGRDYVHRDVKPENIVLRSDARDSLQPVLIDFGSARCDAAGKTQHMTAVYTPRYAPIEQYSATSRQGPFTDIYALAAVSYRVLAGEPPPAAADRVQEDRFRPLAQRLGQRDDPLLAAIDGALAVRPRDRPQSIPDWRASMEIAPAVPDLEVDDPPEGVPPPTPPARSTRAARPTPDIVDLPEEPVPPAPRPVGTRMRVRRMIRERVAFNGNPYLECETDVGIVAFWGRKEADPDNISRVKAQPMPFTATVNCIPVKDRGWHETPGGGLFVRRLDIGHDHWVLWNERVDIEREPRELSEDDIPF